MRGKSAIGFSLFFLIIAGLLSCSFNSEEIDELETQVTKLTSELQQKQEDYNSLVVAHHELELTAEQMNQDIEEFRDENVSLNSELIVAQTEIAKLNASSGPTISSLITQIGELQAENDNFNIQVAQLTKQLTPSPDHALTWVQVKNDPDLRSTSWAGQGYTWQSKVEEIGRQYHASHIFIEGETDCNDMAIDIWNMLLAQDIKSVITIGSLDNSMVTFDQCDHAWLSVFDSEGEFVSLEPTTGQVFYSNTAGHEQYIGGFFYKKPSDLRSDMMKRW
ncbi:MAG: hypothetical protein HOC20_04900 [Chloroflexi bacterium]|jgi:hypothetical protein|nr:hypothetical protein [Chloroflexota bacterium]